MSDVKPENQTIRMSKNGESFMVFPFPPIKGKKWLLLVENEKRAKEVLQEMGKGLMPGPLEEPNYFENLGTHIDGKTPLFGLKE